MLGPDGGAVVPVIWNPPPSPDGRNPWQEWMDALPSVAAEDVVGHSILLDSVSKVHVGDELVVGSRLQKVLYVHRNYRERLVDVTIEDDGRKTTTLVFWAGAKARVVRPRTGRPDLNA
ncbi:hypothetical protein Acsp01_57950 [Actinoplanes sp. NBRC 101535]|nr:hypothetical protein Acsp01_57950 [Actinoplanes sp. NBRC 101535]